MGKTVCIEFDNTLCKSDGEPIAGALEALQGFKEAGHTILISSARLEPDLWGDLLPFREKEIAEWLEKHGIPYDKVVIHKPPADLYIDDKGYRFKGDWDKEIGEISGLLDR